MSHVVPVSLCPPSPFPRTTVLFPIPSRPTGEYFRGPPSRPLPVGSPWPRTLRPPNLCHGPLTFPPSPFLCHARGPFAPSPKSSISSGPVSRSNPAPRARARPLSLPWLQITGAFQWIYIHPIHNLKSVFITHRTHTIIYIYYMLENKIGRIVFNPTDLYISKTRFKICLHEAKYISKSIYILFVQK